MTMSWEINDNVKAMLRWARWLSNEFCLLDKLSSGVGEVNMILLMCNFDKIILTWSTSPQNVFRGRTLFAGYIAHLEIAISFWLISEGIVVAWDWGHCDRGNVSKVPSLPFYKAMVLQVCSGGHDHCSENPFWQPDRQGLIFTHWARSSSLVSMSVIFRFLYPSWLRFFDLPLAHHFLFRFFLCLFPSFIWGRGWLFNFCTMSLF